MYNQCVQNEAPVSSRHAAATICEIFSGIQGEGTLVGYRQLFVRFHGCNLACRYCDTAAARRPAPATCAVETAAGGRVLTYLPNPLTVAELLTTVRRLAADYPHHSLSLTGGEPLLYGGFLNVLLPKLHAEGYVTYLETNGVCSAELAGLHEAPRLIAMDIKLPSAAGIPPRWDAHDAFLAVALTRVGVTGVQVKCVFGAESLADVTQAAQLVAVHDPATPFILQPVTPGPAGPSSPDAAMVLEAQRLAARYLRHVRVIPQTHMQLGQW